jgi:mRNA interferase RelE/StbE
LTYRIVVQKKAAKVLQSLPGSHLRKFSELLDILRINPIPWRSFDVRKIKGIEDTYRVRIGDYRVVYFIDNASSTIHILKFDIRGNVY